MDQVPESELTPHSADSQSTASDLESEYLKLKSEFQEINYEKLFHTPTRLLGQSEPSYSHRSEADSIHGERTPVYRFVQFSRLSKYPQPVKCVSFLSEACAKQQIRSSENDFVLCTGKEIVICGLASASQDYSFMPKGKFVDESPTEKFMVVRFVIKTPTQVMVAAGGKDGVVKLFSLSNVQTRFGLMGHRHTIRDLRPMDDSDFLFSCSDDLSIRLWNIRTRVLVAQFQGILAHTDSIRALDVHHSQEFLVSGGLDSCVQLWSITGKVQTVMRQSKEDREESMVVSGIRCVRKSFKTLLVTQPAFFTFKAHSAGVCAVRFYHDLVISQDKTNRVCVWLPNPERATSAIILIHSISSTEGFVMKPSTFGLCTRRGILTIAGNRGEMQVWNLMELDSKPIIVEYCPSIPIRGMRLSEDGSHIIAMCKPVSSLGLLLFRSG